MHTHVYTHTHTHTHTHIQTERLSSLRSNRRPSPSSPHSDKSTTSNTVDQHRVKKSPQISHVHQTTTSTTSHGSSNSYQSSVAQNPPRSYHVSYSREPVISTSSMATTSSRPHNYEILSYSNQQQPSSSLPRNDIRQNLNAITGPPTSENVNTNCFYSESHMYWDSQPGDFSSFPRQVMHQNRGTKAYSSARYSSSSTDGTEGEHRQKKISRNASFSSPTHHSSGVSNLISPLARHPSTVHEEGLSEMNDSAYYSTITAHSGNNYSRKFSLPGSTTGAGGNGSERGQLGRKSTSGGQIPTTSGFEIGTSMIGGGSVSRGSDGQGYLYGQSTPQQFVSNLNVVYI